MIPILRVAAAGLALAAVIAGLAPAEAASPAPAAPAGAASAPAAAPAGGPRDLPAIVQAGELRVAADPSAGAPYFAAAASGHAGFEADMATALARRLGVKPVFVPTAWRDLRAAIEDGRADVALNALEIRDDARVRFTAPYYVASQAILVRADDTSIYDLRDLAGRKVASTRGSVAAAILAGLKPPAKAVLADDTASPFRALADHHADAVLLEAAMVRSWLKKDPKTYRLAGRPVLPRPYGAAVRRGSPKLLAAIDGAFGAMRKDGEHAKILRAWGLWDSLQAGGAKAVAQAAGATPAPGASPKPGVGPRPGAGPKAGAPTPAPRPVYGPTPLPGATPVPTRAGRRSRRHRHRIRR